MNNNNDKNNNLTKYVLSVLSKFKFLLCVYKRNKKKLNMKHHVQMGRVPTITENKIRPIILISLSQIDQLWQYPFIADVCI